MNPPEMAVRPALAAALRKAAEKTTVDDSELAKVEYQAEVADAMDHLSGSGITELAEAVQSALERRPWMVLLRGLPPEAAMAVLVAVSARLGTLVEPYRESWSRFVRSITPPKDRAVEGKFLNEFLHTDGTDWPTPNDLTCLFCVTPGAEGGLSRLTDVETVIDAVESSPNAKQAMEVATMNLPWRLSGAFGSSVHHDSILDLEQGTIRWLRYGVTASAEVDDALVTPEILGGTQTFERIVEGIEDVSVFGLEAGDLLILDNTRCLHARTGFADAARSNRELLRTKVVR